MVYGERTHYHTYILLTILLVQRQPYLLALQWGWTLTHLSSSRLGRSAIAWAVITVALVAWVMPMVAPPASAVTEYRYEVIVAPPTPLDYKGVSWAPDGSEATIVGGVRVLLAYDADSRRAVSAGDGNWSTTSQTLEDVVYTADGKLYISGGVLDDSTVTGDLWQLVGEAIQLRGSAEGDILQAVTASPDGRVVAVGALGSVMELTNGSLELIGSAGDTVIQDAAWAPDGSGILMVGAAGTIVWMDATNNEMVPVEFTSTQTLHAVGWHPDSDMAWAVGEGGLVVEVVRDPLEATRVRPYTPRSEDLFGVAWHPSEDIALVVGEEGIAYLYRLGVFTQQRVDTNKYLLDVEWNPMGDEALVVGESGTLLRYTARLTPQNRAPNAVISSPSDGAEVESGNPITFDGSTSSDPDDDPITHIWSTNSSGLLGADPVIERYLSMGTHQVTLTVDDGQGNNHTDTVTVHVVEPVPPEDRLHLAIKTPLPGSLLEGKVVISGTASYELGEISSVEVAIDGGGWHPADGSTSWSLTLDTSIYEDGIHSIVVKVTADDVFKTDSILIEVRNTVPPLPPEIPNITLHMRDHGEVDQLISFSVDGENLTAWLLVWSFGDGSNGQGEKVHHAYNEEGSYQVTLELWLEGYHEPSAVFTATVVIETATEDGLSPEVIIILIMLAAGVIYIAGYYGGRHAFRRD